MTSVGRPAFRTSSNSGVVRERACPAASSMAAPMTRCPPEARTRSLQPVNAWSASRNSNHASLPFSDAVLALNPSLPKLFLEMVTNGAVSRFPTAVLRSTRGFLSFFAYRGSGRSASGYPRAKAGEPVVSSKACAGG